MNKKNILITILLFAILVSVPLDALAQEAETEQTETATTEEATEELDEGKDILEEELLLLLPAETDNPNLTLSFSNPSEEPITLEIDGKEAIEISNPYTLPSLGIGRHILVFNFIDSEEAEQTEERDIIIVPRVPVINPPEDIQSNRLVVNGESLAASTIELLLTGGTETIKERIEVDISGEWEFIFEEELEEDTVYTLLGYTRKYGYASELSQPVIFTVEGSSSGGILTTDDDETKNGKIVFDLAYLSTDNIQTTVQDNPHLGLLVLGAIVIGALVGFILSRLTFLFGSKASERSFRQMISRKDGDSTPTKKKKSKKAKTDDNSLKSKFESNGRMKKAMMQQTEDIAEDDEPVETEEETNEEAREDEEKESKKSKKQENKKKKQKKSMQKELTKEEFLAQYKDFDPDGDEESIETEEEEKPKKKKASKKVEEQDTDPSEIEDDKDKKEDKKKETKKKKKKKKEKEKENTSKKEESKQKAEVEENNSIEDSAASFASMGGLVKMNLGGSNDDEEKEDKKEEPKEDKKESSKDKESKAEAKKKQDKSIKITLTSNSLGD